MNKAPAKKESIYIDVAVPVPARKTFYYRLDGNLAESAAIGSRVLVPFGKQILTGYIIEIIGKTLPDKSLEPEKIRDVIDLLDIEPLISHEILELTRWAADYYAASWGEMIKAALPAGINANVEKVITLTEKGHAANHHAKRRLTAKILDLLISGKTISLQDLEKQFSVSSLRRTLSKLVNEGLIEIKTIQKRPLAAPKLRKAVRLLRDKSDEKLTPQQEKVLSEIKSSGGEMYFSDLLDRTSTGASPVHSLVRRGLLEIFVCEQLRDPLRGDQIIGQQHLTLSEDQEKIFRRICESSSGKEFQTFLLHGVTGSGKTEIYIRAMEAMLKQGRSSLLLVPEISLTPIFSRRLRGIFGQHVAILHSNLSTGERFDEWRRIRAGDAKIVIGTRSAIFAPLERPGLIIVDEEHDASYRQSEAPHYNARDLAVVRAKSANAITVLGSATPSLESFHNARIGKYTYLQLTQRIEGRPMAKAELIDMREVFRRFGKDPVLSPSLISAIEETHKRGEQTIILLNRRGYSSFVLCRTCGEMIKCINCDITLTFHKAARRLSCHYCGYHRDVPKNCPQCSSEYLYFIGEGTERVEELIAAKFPNLRIARVDRDSVRRKGELDRILLAFGRGEFDLLVGTQMLAKGHDFHSVTLVGVISVDIGLGLPDFRAAERTFQLLTQVAGRAGRGNLPGRVLIQTYYPEHYALQAAVNQDYEQFYRKEIKFREQMGYPPFAHLISIIISHKNAEKADRTAKILRNALDRANPEKLCRILGPAPAALSLLKGLYRRQILLKSNNRKHLRSVMDQALEIAETLGCEKRFLEIEIDPVDLL